MHDSRFYYLLHSEQHHSLFGNVFGKHLKAKQHVRGGHCVQGMGRQEHALKAVFCHLRERKTVSSNCSSSASLVLT